VRVRVVRVRVRVRVRVGEQREFAGVVQPPFEVERVRVG